MYELTKAARKQQIASQIAALNERLFDRHPQLLEGDERTQQELRDDLSVYLLFLNPDADAELVDRAIDGVFRKIVNDGPPVAFPFHYYDRRLVLQLRNRYCREQGRPIVPLDQPLDDSPNGRTRSGDVPPDHRELPPEAQAVWNDRMEQAGLNAEEQAVVRYRVLEGRTWDEIAKLMNLTRDQVRARWKSGCRKLRRVILREMAAA
jgi:predicted DNA-binding protein (UPF0251 family)